MRSLRRSAADSRLGVDAWLGVRLELHVTAQKLTASPVAVSEVVAAASSGDVVGLPPNPALRRWVQMLEGAATELPRDELPTVVLPERLVTQVPPARLAPLLQELAARPDDASAMKCDIAAARHGQTMEAWMLRAALALSRCR